MDVAVEVIPFELSSRSTLRTAGCDSPNSRAISREILRGCRSTTAIMAYYDGTRIPMCTVEVNCSSLECLIMKFIHKDEAGEGRNRVGRLGHPRQQSPTSAKTGGQMNTVNPLTNGLIGE